MNSYSQNSNSNNTTSIDDLPIDKKINDNVRLEINEIKSQSNTNVSNTSVNDFIKPNAQIQQPHSPPLNDYKDTLINDLKNASMNGMLKLPSRDIPQTNNHITQDIQTKANFIPNENINDYINQYHSHEDIIRNNTKSENRKHEIDDYYNEFKIPLLICILYFIFNLPSTKNIIYTYLPFLINKENKLNVSGFIVNSILFSSLFFIVNKGIHHLSN